MTQTQTTQHTLQFDAIDEPSPGSKWQARWQRSWPEYAQWFERGGGLDGPSRCEGVAALREYLPELVPIHRRLTELAGGSDTASRFLATWCPPTYLGGCSLVAKAAGREVRLVRNYDLSPQLNEGLLLRSAWNGRPVLGMVEFLWGLSDGVNADGLCIALAYGGSSEVRQGFGITTIVRYLLETCSTAEEAVAAVEKVPSHMAYNLVFADRQGTTASLELAPGGGVRRLHPSIATNHQIGVQRPGSAERTAADFAETLQRRRQAAHLLASGVSPRRLTEHFLMSPLYQTNYDAGFGTLFTAAYDPVAGSLQLRWPGACWQQQLDQFEEGQRIVRYRQGEGADVCADFSGALRRGAGCPTTVPRADQAAAGLGRLVASYWPGIPDELRALLDGLAAEASTHPSPT